MFYIVESENLLAQLLSQGLPSQLPDSVTIMNVQFTRMLNTFVWNGVFHGSCGFDDWRFNYDQRINSRLYRSSSKSLQDDYTGSLKLQKQVNEWFTVLVRDTSQILSSNQSLEIGSLSSQKILLGGEVLLPSQWSFVVESGYEHNRQASILDKGLTLSSRISNPVFQIDEFSSAVQIGFSYSDLSRRKPYDGGVMVFLGREFAENVMDSLTVVYQVQKRDFYTDSGVLLQSLYGVSTNMLSRSVNTLQLMNIVTLQSANDIVWKIQTSYSYKSIYRAYQYKLFSTLQTATPLDTRINELQLLLGTWIDWSIVPWWSFHASFQYMEREESHDVIDEEGVSLSILEKQRADSMRLENISKRSVVSANTKLSLTERDSLTFETSVSLLRYDTPDSTNYNDRDELWISGGAEYLHRFSRSFALAIRTDFYLDHLVYLSRRQSANNNWNRVLRLECRSSYQPSEMFRTFLRAEVLANYSVSDYEKQVASIKSYAFRQFRCVDSTMIRFTDRLGMEVEGSVRLFERGILRWKDFRERPEQFYGEYMVLPSFVLLPAQNQKIQLGYKLFLQEQYKYNAKAKILEQVIRSDGPTVLCQLQTLTYQLSIEGWYERQTIDGRTIAKIPNISITTSYIL